MSLGRTRKKERRLWSVFPFDFHSDCSSKAVCRWREEKDVLYASINKRSMRKKRKYTSRLYRWKRAFASASLLLVFDYYSTAMNRLSIQKPCKYLRQAKN